MPLAKPSTVPYFASLANWQASTGYVVGQRVLNDSGKIYQCTAAGTSAGSGGPTGTGGSITDGSVTWSYQSSGGAVGNLVTPPQTEQDIGWTDGQKPPASYFNSWMARVVAWVQYLENITDRLLGGTVTLKALKLDGTGGAAVTPEDGQVVLDGGLSHDLPIVDYGETTSGVSDAVTLSRALMEAGAGVRWFLLGDSGGLALALNASWNGTAWARDIAASAYLFVFSGDFVTYRTTSPGNATPWSSWGTATNTLAGAGGLTAAGNVEASGDPASDQARLKGKQIVTSAAAKPTIAVGVPAGTGATATVTNGSTDIAGSITIATGTTTGAGTLATVTLNKAYPAAPYVVLGAINANSAGLAFYVGAVTAAGGGGGQATFTIDATAAGLTDSVTYTLAYHVIGTAT